MSFGLARQVLAALIALACSFTVDAQVVDPLFSDANPTLAGPAMTDPRPFVVRSRTAILSRGTLDRALASPTTDSFILNVFDDTPLAVTFERREIGSLGHLTWSGHITDRPLSTVSLTEKDGRLTGMVTEADVLYEIYSVGDGAHRINQLTISAMPRAHDVVIPGAPQDRGPSLAGPSLASPAVTHTIDIFVYYTTGLRASIGLDEVQSRIAQYIANTNTAYARSGVDGRLHLVGSAEINAPESSDSVALLNSFSADSTVAAQRNASNADLMALVIREFGPVSGGIVCGIGHLGAAGSTGAAYSITASRSECLHTFPHEVGHNLGGQHHPDDGVRDPAGSAQYPVYARGHKVPGLFATLMSYACGGNTCPRILNFSSPAVLEAGQPTGIANQRDNARRLRELFPQVAAYRTGAPPQPPTAPLNLQASTSGLSVTLRWQPPASGLPLNYIVVGGTAPGLNDVGEISVGLATSVSGPLAPRTYYARVFAQNAVGNSLASNEVSFTLGTTPPGVPRNLTFGVTGSTVSLGWQVPSTGGPPTDYLIDAGTASGFSNLVNGLPVAATSFIAPGVGAGRYFVRVRARNAGGVSGPSNEVEIQVGCTLPSAPRNLATTKNGSLVAVSWSAPAIGVPSAYILQAGTVSGAANVLNGSVGLTTSFSGQPSAGTYFVRVLASNACGTGPASGEMAVTVP